MMTEAHINGAMVENFALETKLVGVDGAMHMIMHLRLPIEKAKKIISLSKYGFGSIDEPASILWDESFRNLTTLSFEEQIKVWNSKSRGFGKSLKFEHHSLLWMLNYAEASYFAPVLGMSMTGEPKGYTDVTVGNDGGFMVKIIQPKNEINVSTKASFDIGECLQATRYYLSRHHFG